jgi:molecular chaperone Hsp33
MELALAGFSPEVLDTYSVGYRCNCSRERTERMLYSLGQKELKRMCAEDPSCEVVCHFCNRRYTFDLQKLLAEMPVTPGTNPDK